VLARSEFGGSGGPATVGSASGAIPLSGATIPSRTSVSPVSTGHSAVVSGTASLDRTVLASSIKSCVRKFNGNLGLVALKWRIVDSTRWTAKDRALSINRASSAACLEAVRPARLIRAMSAFADMTTRCRSAFKCPTSAALSAVMTESSAGHMPPVTQGVQSTGRLKRDTFSDSREALRSFCLAEFRPKIAIGKAYRQPTTKPLLFILARCRFHGGSL
ncbi:MAG: hypothetical protein QOE12_2151, partial [Mycobacterium sp.]|nr:hypothetical protein [Mycobacterium sp.]